MLKFPANFHCVYPQEGGWEGTRGESIGIFGVQALENDIATVPTITTTEKVDNLFLIDVVVLKRTDWFGMVCR